MSFFYQPARREDDRRCSIRCSSKNWCRVPRQCRQPNKGISFQHCRKFTLTYFMQVGLARAARTDAGVHAAGNLVSLKMIITIPGVRDIVARINEELPPEIRLWNYVRTQNSFN